jgi:uncharacterized membrane protein (UPF0136 family)
MILLAVYALLLAAGGLVGFLKAGSRPSLVAGLVSGVLVAGCAALVVVKQPMAGRALGMTLALLLGVFFGYRYALKPKFMPSGLMTVVSILVLVLLFFITPMPPG